MDTDEIQSNKQRFWAWAQLVRLPNTFTVVADVSAAYLLVGGGLVPFSRYLMIVLAGIALYWAGMVLNDVLDVERDQKERPNRPIPSGRISVSAARKAVGGLLASGICFAIVSGRLPADEFAPTWVPAIISIILSLMIVLYDGPLKKTLLAPAAMGGCRFFSFLLGASPLMTASNHLSIPSYVFGFALGFGLYIMGVTTIGRDEAGTSLKRNLYLGLLFVIAGAALLAYAPQTSWGDEMTNVKAWSLSPYREFPILIALIIFPVVVRAVRCIKNPVPESVQSAVRSGVLTIIPLSAAVALLGAGPIAGISVLGLIIPTRVLAARFRVT